MTDMSFASATADEGCQACGVEPCNCPEAAAAIAAAPAPDFVLYPERRATTHPAPGHSAAIMQLPAAERLEHAPGMPAAGYQAAIAFLARRSELEDLHGPAASCHPDRPPLCTLIDADGRIGTIKGLLAGRPDRSDLERAALHIATIGAMMTSLYQRVSAELAIRPREERH